MTDYGELMGILSVPRPNGSAAVRATASALADWLGQRGIHCRKQRFTLYPYYFEAIGLWFILSRGLLAAAVWLRWGWPALAIALLAVLGGTLDKALLWPLVTWPGRRTGINLLAEFGPLGRGDAGGRPAGQAAACEIILSAHYDSKTELLDHNQRLFFLRRLPLSLGLTLAVGLLGLADGLLRGLSAGSGGAQAAFILAALLAVPMLFLSWGLGLYMALGRLARPSQGAVDNGAACAILLGLAERLQRGGLPLQHTQVTIALFGGEEVNMQGSRAYVHSRDWLRPAVAVNLEVLGQDGGYIYFLHDGDVVRRRDTSPEVNALLCSAVSEVTGQPPQAADLVNSDGFSFLAAGIPTAVLASYDRRLLGGGFHTPADNLGRVALGRLPEAVEILAQLITRYDQAPAG